MSAQHPSCPLCGNPILDDGRLLVDLEGGLIVRGHDMASLTRTEMAMFGLLWARRPAAVTKEALLASSTQPGRDDDRELKLVDVIIHKVRRKLGPLDIRIGTARGEGYRLEMARQKAEAA